MILDFNEATGAYFLRGRRNEINVRELMREHGLDFSVTASDPGHAVMLTHEPYAAVTFFEHGTERAKRNLQSLHDEIMLSWKSDSKAHIRCPADQELWPFQKADIEYALRRRHTLVGDQPGLGKTPIAICYANEINAQNVLVICPASIRLQWAKRIQEWSTMRHPYHIHTILHSKRGVHPHAAWTIISYDLCRVGGLAKALTERTYDLLVLDEAHYLKTTDAGRTRAIFGGGEFRFTAPIVGRCGSIMALTGTPLPNRPREAYTLARALNFDSIDFMSEDHFRNRFNPSMRGERIDATTGKTKIFIDERTGRHSELQNRLRANFMTRHLKRDVMTQLHMPVYDLIQVEETGAVKQALKAESLLDIDPEQLEGADAAILGHIAVVRRMMGVAMAPQVADYINMLIDGGEEKIVLFAWHHEVMDILQKALDKHGLVRIDGNTGAKKKEHLCQQFINNPSIQVCLGNLQSMGVGTDGLQLVSNHALIAEPSWTPGDNIQAFDRLDRGGQTRQVQGDIFVAPGSFAERVLASALRKNQVIHKALDRRM